MINKEDRLKIGLAINRIACMLDDDSLAKVKDSLDSIEATIFKCCEDDTKIKKVTTRKEFEDIFLYPMREALDILKENDMHEMVSVSLHPDTDYVSFFCHGTGNRKIHDFNYFEHNEYKKGEYL